MKKNLLLALLFISSAFQVLPAQEKPAQGEAKPQTEAAKQQAEQSSIKKLSTAEVDQLLDSHKHVYILDVRKPEEIAQLGTLKGSINIPIDQLEQRLNEVPKNKLILTLSNHAGRGSKAAELLEKNGYKVAGAAGIQTYTADGGTKYLVHPEIAKKQ